MKGSGEACAQGKLAASAQAPRTGGRRCPLGHSADLSPSRQLPRVPHTLSKGQRSAYQIQEVTTHLRLCSLGPGGCLWVATIWGSAPQGTGGFSAPVRPRSGQPGVPIHEEKPPASGDGSSMAGRNWGVQEAHREGLGHSLTPPHTHQVISTHTCQAPGTRLWPSPPPH